MQKVILGLLMITVVFGMDVSNKIEKTDACIEFKNEAKYYYNKSMIDKLYGDRYSKLADYFEMMYNDCLRETKESKSYSGYRDNIIQQQIQK